MGRSASPLDDGMPRHASGARQNLRATEPDEEPSGRMASTTDSDSDTSIGCDRVSNLPARTMTQGSEASIAPTEPRTPAQMDDAEADRTGNVWHAESPVAPLQSPDPPQRDRRLYFTGEQVKCAPSEIAHSGTKKQLAWPLIDNPPPTVPACPDLVPFPGPRDGQHALADTCGDRDSSVGGCRGGTNRLPSPIVEGINWGCSRACCTLRNTSRNRTMAMMVLINWFLFMDQNLMAPNLSDMARDFGMTDDERDVKLGGQISMSLFLVGTPVSLVVGHYADRVNRKALYTAVVMCGEVGCLLTFLVKEYWQLFVLRALTGVSLGGALPLVFSMISDMYPAHERPRATAMMGLSCGVGVGTGQLVAAVLGGGPSGWRLPFVVVSAPCLLALLVFHFVAREPTRASQETIFQEIMRDAGEGKGDLEAGTGLVKAREGAGTEQGPHMARMPSCRARSESPCQRRFPDAASGHRALAPSERGVASSAWGSTSLRRHCRVQSDDMRWWGGSSTEQPMSLGRGDGHRRNLSNGSMLSSDGAGVVHRRNPSWEMWGWGVQERPMRCGLGDGHRRNLSKLSSVSTDGAGVVHRRNQSRGRGHHRMHSDGSVVVANLGAAAVGAEEECGKEAPFERVVSIPEAVNGDAVQNVEEGQRKATGVFGGCMQFSRDVARLFRRRSNVLIFCQGFPGCIPWGVMNVFLMDYLISNRGASKEAAFLVSACFGLGATVGQILAGIIGPSVYKRDKRYLAYFMSLCQLASIAPVLGLLHLPFKLYLMCPLGFIGGLFALMAGPNIKAVVLNVNVPCSRGVAMAIFGTFDDIGQGLGPAIIASLVVVVGRQTAFSIAACCWSLSAFIIFLLSFTMVEDEASVEAEVADMLLKSASRSVVRPDTDSGSGKQRADEVGEARDFSML